MQQMPQKLEHTNYNENYIVVSKTAIFNI